MDAVVPGPPPRCRRGARPRPRRRAAPRSSTSAPTSGCATRPTTRAGTASSTRDPTSSTAPSTACPSCIAPSSQALVDAPVAIVGSPGCYPTATLLALAPLARAGLIGDLVVDAKSGVSGAGRDPKPELMFGEVNESVKAYGLGGHRHVAEIEQELALAAARDGLDPGANPGAVAVDFLPHLIPMTRGILSTGHVRPTRPVDQAELDELYAERLRRRAVRARRGDAARDQAHDRQQPRARPRPARRADRRGSWPSASRTTSSRARRARPSRRSTSSTACRRRPASSSCRWRPR